MGTSSKVEFVGAAGESLAGRLELPDQEPTTHALFAHCFTCSKDVAAASRISRGLAGLGVGVLRFDFTGLGDSDGDFSNTNFSSNVDDLRAAATWLGEQGRPVSLLIGHSLGGAAVLATAPHVESVRAVVTIGAPSAPQHVEHLLEHKKPEIEAAGLAEVKLGGRRFTIRRQFLEDLAEQRLGESIKGLRRALLVMHSPVDEIVPIDEARKIYETARHPKSFISLDDADHLLTRREDSEYVASLLCAWASRYVEEPA